MSKRSTVTATGGGAFDVGGGTGRGAEPASSIFWNVITSSSLSESSFSALAD